MENKTQQIIMWILIIIGLGAIVLGMIGFVSQEKPAETITSLVNPISSNDWVMGDKNAKVTLVEYSDFQCPACAYYYAMTKKLEQDFPNDLAVVYRHFPLTQIHKYANLAAQAAEAAGKQGKFWEMHDVLFEKQSEWSQNNNALQKIISYAQILGLKMDKFMADINSQEIAVKIQNSILAGEEQKLIGTPTFFLNGKQISNPASYEEFKKLVEDEVKK